MENFTEVVKFVVLLCGLTVVVVTVLVVVVVLVLLDVAEFLFLNDSLGTTDEVEVDFSVVVEEV